MDFAEAKLNRLSQLDSSILSCSCRVRKAFFCSVILKKNLRV